MTIMLAGGITVGAQGFVPEAYADHNANLFVSAEKTGNSFYGLQIVEIVIIDEDLAVGSTPDVTVNGEDLTMTLATDGNHYAYFASDGVKAVADARGDTVRINAEYDGLDFGICTDNQCTNDGTAADDDGDDLGNVLTSTKDNENADDNATWPFIQLFAFPSTVEIEYNRAGGAERTVLDFDDNSEGMTLDRATYPPGAQIHAIINDHRLNIDPTSADAWTWNAENGDMYYRLNVPVNAADDLDTANADPDNTATDAQLVNTKIDSDAVCEGCSIAIDPDAQGTGIDIITTMPVSERPVADMTTDYVPAVLNEDGTIRTAATEATYDYTEAIWVSVREISGPNTAMFATTDLGDNSVLRVSSDAQRDRSATIGYDGDDISVVIKHSTADISIDAPTDVWTSGLAIPVTIVDDDINKNSLSDETISVSVTDAIIPTLVTGDPFTLGEVGNNLVTWVVYPVTDSDPTITTSTSNTELERLLTTYDDIDANGGTSINFTGTDNDVFELRNVNLDVTPSVSTGSTLVVFENSATVESFSDRAILSFNDIEDRLVQTSFDGLTSANNELLTGFPHLVIDLPGGLDELRDSLVNDNATDAHGTNLINFNVASLGDEVKLTGVGIMVGGTEIALIDVDDAASGYQTIDDDEVRKIFDSDATGLTQLRLDLTDTTVDTDHSYPIVLDIFSFGFTNNGEASSDRVANQIIRFELEESDPGTFEGTLEYVMVNQLNILDEDTYAGLTPTSDEVSFVVIEDLTGSDAPTVTYLDVGADGVATQVSAQEDAPSHSGVVSLDVETFKVADTVTVTLEDLDLNVQSELIDIYSVVDDVVGTAYPGVGPEYLGQLLEITFDDERWESDSACTPANLDNSHNGLGATGFSLVETTIDSGVFTGSFQIPAKVCLDSEAESSTGLDIAVNYVDFRDASGETTEVSSDAGVKANTGSVSFDRTVYPVPFGSDPDGESKFEHVHGVLSNGDLIVYVSVNDPDFDVSASGEDTIALDGNEPVTVTVSRGSASPYVVERVGGVDSPITEIAPDAGIFEAAIEISYNDGPADSNCPAPPTGVTHDNGNGHTHDDNGNHTHCILQGDILQVEYDDPTDASGESNTVTDSATFDLRNGVLQSDKSVYIIGSDMILTLIEPDFDLDSSQNETYDLDLIEWDSSAATVTMGRDGGESGAFDPEPFSLRETGPNTGIFQVVIEIPAELEGDSLERGEEIELIYVDWGPSGSEYVGDNDEEISLTVFTSNFGASVEMDQKIYTWTDKVYITIVAPDHNFDSQLIDEIGEEGAEDELRIGTRENSLDGYRLVETGADTGIFTGEVILTGFTHDPIGYDPGNDRRASGSGPTDGYLETEQDGGISVSYEFSGDETVLTSSLIRWNIGEVQWLEASYPASGNGILRIIDPDMSLNPEAVDNFDIKIASSSDASGIRLTVTETNEATGIFEGTVFFTTTSASSGHRLRIAEGDTVTAIYDDATLPDPYTTADSISITATTLIGTIVPPLERAPASDLRVVDPFGNSLSTVSPDQQVQVSANLANGQDRDQDFAYLVQIQDSDGVTVALAWIAGSLSPGQSFSPAVSWIPTEAGTYTVTAFVWESVDNPTALSPPVTIDVSVN